jgi:hypothetical protein
MIPKKIHYCWFSGEAFPESVLKCMDSWKRILLGYELVLWNAEKALATGIPWVRDALEQRRWAFASDAVRLYALKSEGGIYLDTDVEVLKSFDDLLERDYFFGYENGSERIEGAVMGAAPNSPAVVNALEFYRTHPFSYKEREVDDLVLPNILARAFEGLPDLEIFPEHVFSPKSYIDGKIRLQPETRCIHHFASSWRPQGVQRGIARRQWLYAKFPRPLAHCLARILSVWTNLQNLGFAGTLKKACGILGQRRKN